MNSKLIFLFSDYEFKFVWGTAWRKRQKTQEKYKIFWKLHDILNELITKGLKIINRRTLITKPRYIKYNN